MIPDDGVPDSTLELLRQGYLFLPRRFRRLDTDMFRTRLMLRPAVCVQGAEAARMFYTPGRFSRTGALPPTTLRQLQDKGSVATLDGSDHAHRKALFMGAMGGGAVDRAADLLEAEWLASLPRWQAAGSIILSAEINRILTRVACRWAGVPLDVAEESARTAEFAAMIDGAGSAGLRAARGLWRRRRTERWARRHVLAARADPWPAASDTPLHRLATWRDPSGRLLDPDTATVELLNLLRPIVAIARYIVFAALALHEQPDHRPGPEADGATVERFVQEVRRLAPFFPMVGGRARHPFHWRGHRFGPGDWVLLDLYGTNRDPRLWRQPGRFLPDRFHQWKGGPFSFIPQGGGGFHDGHRCAGEWITIACMRRAVRLLTTAMTYHVPPQDLRVDPGRMPTGPASGFRMAGIRQNQMWSDRDEPAWRARVSSAVP